MDSIDLDKILHKTSNVTCNPSGPKFPWKWSEGQKGDRMFMLGRVQFDIFVTRFVEN